MVHPKKHLGQHFLTDRKTAEKITKLLTAKGCDTIVEIGPGKGVLSEFLAERENAKVILIEVDSESVAYLRNTSFSKKTEIIEGDFLKLGLQGLGKSIALIGNFPYNISSQIFFKVLEDEEKVKEIVCMLQREVALRLASGPGNKQYGILSVLLQAWYDISVEFHVKPGAFFPPPAVQSTVIRLTRNQRRELECKKETLFRVVKTTFNQRRKMINNSLKSILLPLELGISIPYATKRPEELSVGEFIELSVFLEEKQLLKP